jgi:hypothetical protein
MNSLVTGLSSTPCRAAANFGLARNDPLAPI